MQLIEPSKYAPQSGCETPEPAWKDFADFKNYVHPRQPTSRADGARIVGHGSDCPPRRILCRNKMSAYGAKPEVTDARPK
jgi:hypothetical protein